MEKLTDEDICYIMFVIGKLSWIVDDYKEELIDKLNTLRTAKINYPIDSPRNFDIEYPFTAFNKAGEPITVIGFSETTGWIIKGSCKDKVNTHYFLKQVYLE